MHNYDLVKSVKGKTQNEINSANKKASPFKAFVNQAVARNPHLKINAIED
jgi:hypothetical protein